MSNICFWFVPTCILKTTSSYNIKRNHHNMLFDCNKGRPFMVWEGQRKIRQWINGIFTRECLLNFLLEKTLRRFLLPQTTNDHPGKMDHIKIMTIQLFHLFLSCESKSSAGKQCFLGWEVWFRWALPADMGSAVWYDLFPFLTSSKHDSFSWMDDMSTEH